MTYNFLPNILIRSIFVFIGLLLLLTLKACFTIVHCEGIDLVLWGEQGTIGATYGQLWTKAQRAIWTLIFLPYYLKGTITGLIMSDAYIRFVRRAKDARLEFKQSIKNSEYFGFVFWLLSPLIQGPPKLYTHIRNGTFTSAWFFNTRTLPCFSEFHSLFYVKGIKCIPDPATMYHLLTPIALAHWIIGDGSWTGHGVVLCTDSYSIADCVRLMNVLIVRYRIDCTLRILHGKAPRIYIRANSIPLLRSIVLPYFHPSMYYKLGL